MPDDPKSGERRSNLVLRALIDEMLDRVRELNRENGFWTPEERARAEAELESVMARVRRVAAAKEATAKAAGGRDATATDASAKDTAAKAGGTAQATAKPATAKQPAKQGGGRDIT